MKNSLNIVVLCAAAILFASPCGCSPTATSLEWHPNTKKLDEAAKSQGDLADVSGHVKSFYEALHNKQWKETYNYRVKEYREDVPETTYVKLANRIPWELVSYEILSVEVQNSNKVVLICKFIEGPRMDESYNAVTWIIENGMWRCDRAGPKGMGIFFPSRKP